MGNNNSLTTAVVNIGMILAVIGAAWLTLGELGVQGSWDVVSGDEANLTTDQLAIYGGDVSMMDRAATTFAILTIAVGVGAVGVSRSNPKIVNDLLRYTPYAMFAISLLAYGDFVTDAIAGDTDWDTFTDGEAAFNLFILGSFVTGASKVLKARGKN